MEWSRDLECRKCGADIKGGFLKDLRMRNKKCRCLTSTKSNLVWPCVPGLDFKYYLEGNRTTWSNQPSSPTSPLSRIHTCRRKRHQWQSPKRSLDSMKGEGAVLNFGLGISEYLGCWMYLELGNPYPCINWLHSLPSEWSDSFCQEPPRATATAPKAAAVKDCQVHLPQSFFLWGWGTKH